MSQQHPYTPPLSLIQQWEKEWECFAHIGNIPTGSNRLAYITAQAARWGADQELETCCAIALTDPVCGTKHQRRMLVSHIRERRRPEPPTLKEQAMTALREIESIGSPFVNNRTDDIRRALEQLDD